MDHAIVLALLTACGAPSLDHEPVSVATAPVAPGLSMHLDDLARGDSTVAQVSHAAPGARVQLLGGDRLELDGACLPELAGTCLDLAEPLVVLAEGVADADGYVVLTLDLPLDVPLGPAPMQLIAVSGAQIEVGEAIAPRVQPRPCVDDGLEREAELSTGLFELRACDGREDWLYATLEPGEGVRVQASFDNIHGNVDLDLWTPQRDTLLASSWTDDDEEGLAYLNRTDRPMEVALRAYLFEDSLERSGNDYELEVLRYDAAWCPVDRFEPNDTPVEAEVLLPGTRRGLGACGDDGDDWFAVDVPAGRTLDVGAVFDHDQGDLDLFVFDGQPDSEDDWVARSWTLDSDESVAWTSAKDTTVWVLVRLHSDAGARFMDGNRYDLELDVR